MCYCTVLALFHVAFEGNFQVQAPRSLHDYGGFLRYEFGEARAYIWRGLFSEFYGTSTVCTLQH